MTTDEMLKIPEVAKRLGVHPETVRRHLRDGTLKGFRPGSERFGWRIPASEVERFLRGGDGRGE